jgi:hypothetical protein
VRGLGRGGGGLMMTMWGRVIIGSTRYGQKVAINATACLPCKKTGFVHLRTEWTCVPPQQEECQECRAAGVDYRRGAGVRGVAHRPTPIGGGPTNDGFQVRGTARLLEMKKGAIKGRI